VEAVITGFPAGTVLEGTIHGPGVTWPTSTAEPDIDGLINLGYTVTAMGDYLIEIRQNGKLIAQQTVTVDGNCPDL
jgi:hypothetical protein